MDGDIPYLLRQSSGFLNRYILTPAFTRTVHNITRQWPSDLGNGRGSLRGDLSIGPNDFLRVHDLCFLLFRLTTGPTHAYVLAELPGRETSFELKVVVDQSFALHWYLEIGERFQAYHLIDLFE